jgi:hypothetical protein
LGHDATTTVGVGVGDDDGSGVAASDAEALGSPDDDVDAGVVALGALDALGLGLAARLVVGIDDPLDVAAVGDPELHAASSSAVLVSAAVRRTPRLTRRG